MSCLDSDTNLAIPRQENQFYASYPSNIFKQINNGNSETQQIMIFRDKNELCIYSRHKLMNYEVAIPTEEEIRQ